MRRAGGWILGVTIVAAMGAGAWMAFRPILKRETLTIQVSRGSRDPSSDALISGMTFALNRAGDRAGGYHLRLQQSSVPHEPNTRSYHPPLSINVGETNLVTAMFLVQHFGPENMVTTAELQVVPDMKGLGRAAAHWARETKAGRITVFDDRETSTLEAQDDFIDTFDTMTEDLRVWTVSRAVWVDKRSPIVERVLATKPDLVVYARETAPYGQAFELFDALRKKGYRGLLAMTDSDPEVSYLAVPTEVVDGTFLLSTIGPPSKEFAEAYEPATGRHAGPHAWPGYLLMNAVIDLFERSRSNKSEDLYAALMAGPATLRPCALYQFKEGRFVFIQDLK
jgi:hypothetical protein